MTNEAWQTLSQLAVLVGLLLAAFGGFGAYYFGNLIEKDKVAAQVAIEQEKSRQEAYTGELKSQTLLDPDQEIYPQFEFGDSGAVLKFTGSEGSPLFQLADHNDLRIVRRDGQVKVSTIIRNDEGKIVAQIVENEWKVNPDHTWDRNYSDDALEVIDPTGEVILQVRSLPDRVQFQARMHDKNGRAIGFGKIYGPEGWGGGIEITGPNHPELLMKISPLFKYPSERHLGEFAERDRT